MTNFGDFIQPESPLCLEAAYSIPVTQYNLCLSRHIGLSRLAKGCS